MLIQEAAAAARGRSSCHGPRPLSGHTSHIMAHVYLPLRLVFSTGAILPPRGHVAMCRDISGCHTGGGGATAIRWVEAGDAAQHPTEHRMAPTGKNDLAPVATVPRLRNPAQKAPHRLRRIHLPQHLTTIPSLSIVDRIQDEMKNGKHTHTHTELYFKIVKLEKPIKKKKSPGH